MVASNVLSPLQQRLLMGLELLPDDISLCLLNGKKVPQGSYWQNRPYSKAEVSHAIIHGISLKNSSGKEYHFYPQGYGLMAGYPITVNGEKRYLLVVDQDGPSAKRKLEEISGGNITPTVKTTSGRNDRCHHIYYVTEEYAANLQTKKIATGELGEDGKPEHIEFLWLGRQAVLPPSVHPMTGCYQYLDCCAFDPNLIAHAQSWTIEQMLRESRVAEILKPSVTTSYTRKRRTGEEWTDEEWALSYLSALSLYRADDYDDWVAVGMALHSVSDLLLTNWDNWSRQSSKYKPGECEKKWKSFKREGKVAIGTLAHMAKQDGWRSPFDKSTGRSFSSGIDSGGFGGGNHRPSGSGGSGGDGGDGDGSERTGKVVRFPAFVPLTLEQVTEKIDELIVQGASGSYLTGQLNRLAAASQFYIGELKKLYYERYCEADLEIDREDNRHEVEDLLKLGDQSIDLHDYLPNELAEPLTAWCSWLSIRPAVAMTALFAGVSSLHKVGTELVIHQNQNFRVPPTIYSALVSPSGQRKSPIFNNIIRQPLGILRSEKIAANTSAMQDYEAALAAWEQSENKGQKPQKPKDPTLYYFTNATGEAIPVQASKDPQKALLALIDELSGLLKSENSYRSGRGSDKQDLLSYFDGSGQTVLRAGGIRVDIEKIYLSMFGTIQPAILKSHMSDCSDPDGQWARFLFVNQPLEAATLSDDDGKAVSIRDRIADFYRQIDQLPEMEYRLSRDAFKRYQPIYNQLERFRVTHPQSGMAAVYSKMQGYIGRLALNLHVLWEIASGKACPSEEIPLFIMEMAIALSKFYIGQVKLIHAHSDDEELAPHIVKLVELSKRLETNGKDGWIKAQQYRELFAAKKRPSAQKARDWMLEAEAQGFGQTRGSGNRLEYHWFCDNKGNEDNPPRPDNLGKVREGLGKGVPYVETTNNQWLQDTLGNLGKGIPNSSLSKKEVDISEEEPLLEGGSVPEASLSTPQESCEAKPMGNTDLGNNLRKGFPKSSLTSLNDNPKEPAQPEEVDAITPQGTEAEVQRPVDEPLKIGDRVNWVECPAHCEHFSPFEIMSIDGDYAKLDLFSKPVALVELEKCARR